MRSTQAFTFDRFVQGESNRLACSVCEAVAKDPGGSYNPLFIHGDVGLGKTHLLHAIAHEARKRHDIHPLYVTSERFAINLIQAIQQKRTSEFRKVYRQTDILLIDDVHFLEDKEVSEEELFHTFNALHDRHKQIVLSSDRPPDDLRDMQHRLVSRFQGGMVTAIQPPDYDVRLAILRAKSAVNGFRFNDGVLEQVAHRVTANVRALEGALIRIAAYADLCGQQLTVADVRRLLHDDGDHERPLSLDFIKVEVAKHYHLDPMQLDGKARDRTTAQVRQIAMYLARELTDSSYPAIGRAFGGRDHATVMHACRRAEELLQTELFRSEIEQVKERLRRLQLYGKAAA